MMTIFCEITFIFQLVVLSVMYIEATVVVIRQQNHVRVTRCLRPIFLIDSHYCGGVRRSVSQLSLFADSHYSITVDG